METFKSKWLEFREFPFKGKTKKTKRFLVYNKDQLVLLGVVKWYSPFRQYSFFPKDDTVYEKTCMTDISAFLTALMEERKALRKPPLVKCDSCGDPFTGERFPMVDENFNDKEGMIQCRKCYLIQYEDGKTN